MKHIDPIGTVLLPLVLLFSGGFLFGYAKPVPLEFGNLRNPKRDTAWVALAGPAANFVMAVLWQIVGLLLTASQVGEAYFLRVAEAGVLTNLLLFAFNLFPLPPLDGGRIMTSLLPAKQAYQLARLEPYGFFIVLALAFFQVLNLWMVPVMTMTNVVIKLIVFPLNLLLN